MAREKSTRHRKTSTTSKKTSVPKPPANKGPRPTNSAKNGPQEIFFYRTNGFLSQWFPAKSHAMDGKEYLFAEQYMMYKKAELFNDDASAKAILEATTPKEIKRLGRQVSNFVESAWHDNREDIVAIGNYHKFTNSEKLVDGKSLQQKLLDTGEAMLIEVSPNDRIWGIGYSATATPNNRDNWGDNLLGKAIVSARDDIREEIRNMKA